MKQLILLLLCCSAQAGSSLGPPKPFSLHLNVSSDVVMLTWSTPPPLGSYTFVEGSTNLHDWYLLGTGNYLVTGVYFINRPVNEYYRAYQQ